MNNRIVTTNASLEGVRSYWKDHKERHFTCAHGQLIPFFVKEILPGDTISVNIAQAVRMNALVAPVMGDVYCDNYFFFVPDRIVFNKLKQFFGENDVSAWTRSTEVELPTIKISSYDYGDGYDDLTSEESENYWMLFGNSMKTGVDKYVPLGTYLYGQPVKNADMISYDADNPDYDMFHDVKLNALPLMSYIAIWNDWFRNENVTDPILFNKDSSTFAFKSIVGQILDDQYFSADNTFIESAVLYPCKVNRFHDLYRSVLPQPQKGDPVTLSLTQDVKLGVGDPYGLGANNDIWIGRGSDIDGDPSVVHGLYGTAGEVVDGVQVTQPMLHAIDSGYSSDDFESGHVNSTNLYAKLSNVAMMTINELRYKFAVQRYLERLARGGSRYAEYIKSMFNVNPNMGDLQMPEYLAGHRVRLSITQITSTAQTTNGGNITPLGQVAGYSLTNDKETGLFTKSFSEHGLLIGVTCFRTPTVYANQLHPFALKKEVFDFYVPPFANIGEVPVEKVLALFNIKDLHVLGENYLGFQEAWFDYRFETDDVIGAINPTSGSGNLGYYTFARQYRDVGLDNEFVLEDRSPILRASAIQGYAFDYICSYYIDYTIARKMPIRSVPGLIDHF